VAQHDLAEQFPLAGRAVCADRHHFVAANIFRRWMALMRD
jgi:hypothetical protein